MIGRFPGPTATGGVGLCLMAIQVVGIYLQQSHATRTDEFGIRFQGLESEDGGVGSEVNGLGSEVGGLGTKVGGLSIGFGGDTGHLALLSHRMSGVGGKVSLWNRTVM